jgi:hypothetical protein
MDRTKPQIREWPVLWGRTTRVRSARPLHDLRLRCRSLGKSILERYRDAPVEVPAPGLKESAIGGVLYQGVLEGIGGFGHRATAEHELGGDQLVEGDLQLGRGPVDDRSEQRVR